MIEIQDKDLNVVLTRLVSGRRHMALVHVPTGISVDAFVDEEPAYKLKDKLMEQLLEKVLSQHEEEEEEEEEKRTQLDP